MHDRAEARPTIDALEELRRVYEELDAELLATGAVCRASTGACDAQEVCPTGFRASNVNAGLWTAVLLVWMRWAGTWRDAVEQHSGGGDEAGHTG